MSGLTPLPAPPPTSPSSVFVSPKAAARAAGPPRTPPASSGPSTAASTPTAEQRARKRLLEANTAQTNPAIINLPALIALSKRNPKDATKAAQTILTAVGDTLPAEVRPQYEELSQLVVENTSVVQSSPIKNLTTIRRESTVLPRSSINQYQYVSLSPFTRNAIETFTDEAIAKLIAYEPDENGFATLKFLVEVDTDEVMEGGARETYEQYIRRLQNKDYVEKTYDLALNALKYYGYERTSFEKGGAGRQCIGVEIDDTRPCWLCGNPVNLFKDARGPTSYTNDNGAEFNMCDPENNSFQCEHLLPAGLMGFLDYLYVNDRIPANPVNRNMMSKLYDSSCRTCNSIKTNNIYIRSTNSGISANFEPNVYEIEKDVIGFFLAINGSKKETCPNNTTQRPVQKDDKYYHSIVTVKKGGITKQYPNLVIAKLNEDEPVRTDSAKRRRIGEPNDNMYGTLSDIFTRLSSDFTIAIIHNTNEFNTFPDSVVKTVPLTKAVQWIQTRVKSIFDRMMGICALLNAIPQKTEWSTKYTNALRTPPYFVQRIRDNAAWQANDRRDASREPRNVAAARALARNREREEAEEEARRRVAHLFNTRRGRAARAIRGRSPAALAQPPPPPPPSPPASTRRRLRKTRKQRSKNTRRK